MLAPGGAARRGPNKKTSRLARRAQARRRTRTAAPAARMGDQANYGREILKRQLLALTKNPPEGISVGLADDDDMYTWEVMIIGPDGTLYEGGM